MNTVTIVGMGMGNVDTLTVGALHALQSAKRIIGAKRLLDSLPDGCGGEKVAAIYPKDIAAALTAFPACVIMSGDTGFYSGTKKLLPLLDDCDVTVLPGITTVQYLAAKLGRPWQDVKLVSAHGLDCDAVAHVLEGRETFFLTGGVVTARDIALQLTVAGLGNTVLHVGQRLSYPDEAIVTGTAEELSQQDFHTLSAVWVETVPKAYPILGGGIPDDRFLRGDVPMTKREVRAAVAGLLDVQPGEVVWDVGAGTGSVSMELALLHPSVQVYAIERNDEACKLIAQNREKFGVYNLRLIPGTAPEALIDLPTADAAFLGGSGGSLAATLQLLLDKNPKVRVCVSAIAAETLAKAVSLLGDNRWEHFEISQISVARSRKAGPYHLMTGQNPIWLISARGRG